MGAERINIEHANAWAEMTKGRSDEIFKHLDGAKDNPVLIAVGGCPVRCIREVNEDGTDTFIGDIGMFRCMNGELMTPDGVVDWENKQSRQDENDNIEVGDPKILWSIGGMFFMNGFEAKSKRRITSE